jgi:adenylate kinase family enzyme
VIDLVVREIQKAESEGKTWLVEGFPRTMIQVMALQKLNILPDMIISLSIRKKQSLARIRNNLQL